MLRHQVMFVVSFSMFLFTFTYADAKRITNIQSNLFSKKASTDLQNVASTIVQTVKKYTMGNYSGPLNIVESVNKYIADVKNDANELYEIYEENLKKKKEFEETQKKVNNMLSMGSSNEIKQKFIEAQTTASKGFQKMKEFDKMREDISQKIHETEIECNDYLEKFNKTLLYVTSLILSDSFKEKETMSTITAIFGDLLSSFYSVYTYTDRLSDLFEKAEKICLYANKNTNDAIKELKEIEAEQKTFFEMKQALALGVKDAKGTIAKDSTSVPSILSNSTFFAAVMMLTMMITNYL